MKSTEEELWESKELYRSLVENSSAGIATADIKGRLSYVNNSFCTMIGYSENELIGKPFANLLHPDDKKKMMKLFLRTLVKPKENIQMELRLIHKDGSLVYCLSSSTIFKLNGKIRRINAIIYDITEWKKIEEEIHNLAKFPSENPFPILRVSKDGKILYANNSSAGLLAKWKSHVGGLAPERWCRLVEKTYKSGMVKEEEEEEEEDSGKIYSFAIVPVMDTGYVNVYGHNITERKKAEDALIKSEEKFRLLFDGSPSGIALVDPNGIIKEVNNSLLHLLSIQKEGIVGKNFAQLAPALGLDVKEQVTDFSNRLTEESSKPEITFLNKSNSKTTINVKNSIIKSGDELLSVLYMIEDITERKKAEEMLKESEAKLRRVIDSSHDNNKVCDLNGIIINCNQATADMHGFSSKEEIIGKTSLEFIAPKDHEKAMEQLKKAFESGLVKNVEYTFLKKDGSEFPVEISANIVRDLSGTPLSYIVVVKDITERKKAENALEKNHREIERQNIQLKKADQLKTDFLNITSHELRTPMSAIKGYVQILLKQTLGQINDDQSQALNVVLRNTNRLDRLIQDILDISRLESGTMKFVVEDIDIRKMISEVVDAMQPHLNQKAIKVHMVIEENLPELIADTERIKQVIINLIDNAIKFSPLASTINIRVRKEHDSILFEFQDFGRGIVKDAQEKIFELFYQVDSGADRKFGGIGLGLAISRGIVVANGGKIWVKSSNGEGSTFYFTLPLQPVKDVEQRFKEMDLFGLERKRR